MIHFFADAKKNKWANYFFFCYFSGFRRYLEEKDQEKHMLFIAAYDKLRDCYKSETISEADFVLAEQAYHEQLAFLFHQIDCQVNLKQGLGNNVPIQQQMKLVLGYYCEAYKLINDNIYISYARAFRPYRPIILSHMMTYQEKPERAYFNFKMYHVLDKLDLENPKAAIQQIRSMLDENPDLTELVLSSKPPGSPLEISVKSPQHFSLLLSALLENNTITKLFYDEAKLSYKYANDLFELLTHNTTLTTLHISIEPGDINAYQRIAEGMALNQHLKDLNLGFDAGENGTGSAITNSIIKSLIRNNFPSMLIIYLNLHLITQRQEDIEAENPSSCVDRVIRLQHSTELQSYAERYEAVPYFNEISSYLFFSSTDLFHLYQDGFAQLVYHIGASLIKNGRAYQITPEQLMIDGKLQLEHLEQDELNDKQKITRDQLLKLYSEEQQDRDVKNVLISKIAFDHLAPALLVNILKEFRLLAHATPSVTNSVLCNGNVFELGEFIKHYMLANSERFIAFPSEVDSAKKSFESVENSKDKEFMKVWYRRLVYMLQVFKSNFSENIGSSFRLDYVLKIGDTKATKHYLDSMPTLSHEQYKSLFAFLRQHHILTEEQIAHYQFQFLMRADKEGKAMEVFFAHLANSPLMSANDLFRMISYYLYADRTSNFTQSDIPDLTQACRLLARGYLYENDQECGQLLDYTLSIIDSLKENKNLPENHTLPQAQVSAETKARAIAFVNQLIQQFKDQTQYYLNDLLEVPSANATRHAEMNCSFFNLKVSKNDDKHYKTQKLTKKLLSVLQTSEKQLGQQLASFHQDASSSQFMKNSHRLVSMYADN